MDFGNRETGGLGSLPDLDLGDMSMYTDLNMDFGMGGGGDDDWGLDF
jgi:mediator of RNA polymerase II transcription subunit 5